MAETAVVEKKEGYKFGKKERKLLTDPINDNNPITVQVLGICSALAVTTGMKTAAVMAVAVVFVCIFSNLYGRSPRLAFIFCLIRKRNKRIKPLKRLYCECSSLHPQFSGMAMLFLKLCLRHKKHHFKS